ncbi:MAG: ABC transporter ATP-binding protein [Candidatus Thermoplasmatota archaeon]|nr:ABC transporter ATP-binding protein [Candidatus Thermoplasmatota archaeon]
MIPSTAQVMPRPGKMVSVRDLKFTYEGGVEALRGVNLDIHEGEMLAIVGGNGSGKTTFAKILNGLLRPPSGSVVVDGKNASSMTVAELAKTVGYAFQNPDHQLFSSTVEDEVRFGPRNLGYPEAEVARMAGQAMDAMRLGAIRGLPPLSLRLSDRRRISIASVIAMDPKVLILDEPTTGLDAAETKNLMESVSMLNREGRTIVLITHDMRLVAEYAHRVVVMSNGRVLLDSDVSGAFSDLALLRQSSLEPPPVTLLAHGLSDHGIPKDIISPQELALRLLMLRGERQ